MDNETFEQIALQEQLIDAPQFLKEAQEVSVLINTEDRAADERRASR